MAKNTFLMLLAMLLSSFVVPAGADDEFMLGDGADGGMGLQSFFSQVFAGGEIDLPQDVDLQIVSANDPEKFLVYHKGAVAVEKLKELEEKKFASTTYAILPVIVAVSKDSPVENISMEELKRVYSGRIDNWSQLKGDDLALKIAGSPFNSPVGRAFRSMVMQQDIYSAKPLVPGTDILPDMLVLKDHNAETALLEAMPGVIVFGGWKLANACNNKYKLLRVDGIEPTMSNIVEKRYPLVVEHSLLYNKNLMPEKFFEVLEFLMKSALADGNFLAPETKK